MVRVTWRLHGSAACLAAKRLPAERKPADGSFWRMSGHFDETIHSNAYLANQWLSSPRCGPEYVDRSNKCQSLDSNASERA